MKIFSPINVTNKHAVCCVDGRSFTPHGICIQMLGGTINLLILVSILSSKRLDDDLINTVCKNLQIAGFEIGAHRGFHAKGEMSDCGFADRLVDIVSLAQKEIDQISAKIQEIADTNSLELKKLSLATEMIKDFDLSNIKMTGNELVMKIEEFGGSVVTMQGDHAEEACFVNMVSDTTHDKASVTSQIFNFDVWHLASQAGSLGLDVDLAVALSFILYVATEMILVESKGKPALPVYVNK